MALGPPVATPERVHAFGLADLPSSVYQKLKRTAPVARYSTSHPFARGSTPRRSKTTSAPTSSARGWATRLHSLSSTRCSLWRYRRPRGDEGRPFALPTSTTKSGDNAAVCMKSIADGPRMRICASSYTRPYSLACYTACTRTHAHTRTHTHIHTYTHTLGVYVCVCLGVSGCVCMCVSGCV